MSAIFNGRFNGRRAIVTGGASGVGAAVAERIIGEGGAASLWDTNASALAEISGRIPSAHTFQVDVTDADAVARAAQATAETLGGVDILVASAGITGLTAPVWELPVEQWRRVMDVNLSGPFYCSRAIVPLMMKAGYGRIVMVSSVAGKEGNPNASAYSASKAGLLGLTKSLGKELAQSNIRVNAVTPATFTSPILAQLPQSQIDYMRSRIPMGRLGEIEEIAALICWLCSEECSFSTAATFDVSGGRTTY